MEPPDFISPQMPVADAAPPAGEGWIHEVKHDGWRMMARLSNGRVRLLSRDRRDWTDDFRIVADELTGLGLGNAYFDGEIIVPRRSESGFVTTSYSQVAGAIRNNPNGIHYAVFDLLHLNGENLRPRPLDERKARLYEILKNAPPHLHYVEHFSEPGDRVITHACALGAEGIVSKRLTAGYRSGRVRDWLKIKCRSEQEFVILGFSGFASLRALTVGVYENGGLKIAGKVRRGFTGQTAHDLHRLLKLMPKAPPLPDPKKRYTNTQWVEPTLIAQIAYLDWMDGGALRNPTYLYLRNDKDPKEVMRENAPPVLPQAKPAQPQRKQRHRKTGTEPKPE